VHDDQEIHIINGKSGPQSLPSKKAKALSEKTMTTVVFSGTGEFPLDVMPEGKKWRALTSLKALLILWPNSLL
jgi:hypothetical protein